MSKKADIEIFSKEQSVWETVKEQSERGIDDAERALIIHRAILGLALNKLKKFS
jgi:hypothetical protein